MELSPLYLHRLQTVKEEGIQQGVQQGIQQGIQQGVQQGIQQGIQQGVQQGIQQGIQQGVKQGQRLMVESMLQVKFGSIDAELAQIIEALIEIPALERTQLILQLSRAELLARFSPGSES